MKRIVLIKDLIGTAPIRIDQRTRNADGSLKYPDVQKGSRPTTLERVWLENDKNGNTWLYWQWTRGLKETPFCNYSGIVLTSTHADSYALEADDYALELQ